LHIVPKKKPLARRWSEKPARTEQMTTELPNKKEAHALDPALACVRLATKRAKV
jgi:hypothetical protein